MRKLGKAVAIVAIILLLMVGGAAILGKIFLTPERIRATVVPMAQEHLGREVALEGIEFSIFSGIVLEGVQVKEQNGADDFIRAERALLRYRLWPLLKLQLEVDEIALLEPHIRVVRNTDASFNYTDLLKNLDHANPEESGAGREDSAAQTGAAVAAISVHIANLSLKNGTLEFLDHAVDPPRTHAYVISNFNLNARAIALRQAFPLEIACSINGAALGIKGQVNLLQRTLKADATLAPLSVEAFAPYFASAFPGTLRSLALSAQLKVDATPETIHSEGLLTLNDISLNLDALPDAPIDDATATLNYTATYRPTAAAVEIPEVKLNYNGILAEFRGDIRNIDSTPILNLDLNTPSIDMVDLMRALPSQPKAIMQELNPGGSFQIQGHIQGELSAGIALVQQAELDLIEVEADVKGIRPSLNGRFLLEDTHLQSEDLTLKMGPNVAQMDLETPNLFASPLKLTHHMRAQQFDLDALLVSAAAPAVVADQSTHKGDSGAAPAELGPFDIPLELNGSITIDKVLYQELPISNFAMNYHLRDNVLQIEKLSGSVAEGSFTQQIRVDLGRRGLGYNGETHVEGLQVDPLITALAPESAHTVSGALNLDMNFSGTGTRYDTLKKNIIAKASLNMQQARISGARLTEELASFLNLALLRDIRFDTVTADVNVRDAVAHIDSNFSGTNMRARPQGTVGLDGSLNLGLNARLAPRLAQELDQNGHIAGLLTDDEGWALIPLKVKGTYAQPRITLDQSALSQQATQRGVEKLKQRLLDKIAPAQKPAAEGTSEQKAQTAEDDPTRELIDNAFKSIFGQ